MRGTQGSWPAIVLVSTLSSAGAAQSLSAGKGTVRPAARGQQTSRYNLGDGMAGLPALLTHAR